MHLYQVMCAEWLFSNIHDIPLTTWWALWDAYDVYLDTWCDPLVRVAGQCAVATLVLAPTMHVRAPEAKLGACP